ncbi:MAG: aspartate kinase [Bdellovibrionales bacterium]|nr:aspartate kinase [Bdellovibrionales bacterium]
MPQQHQIKALASLKFGGTSMGSAASILECAQIIEDQSKNKRCIVTVSAVSGVTNQLLSMVELAKKQKPRLVVKKIHQLEQLHRNITRAFFSNEKEVSAVWEKDMLPIFEKLKAILHGTSLVGDLTHKMQAKVCSFGECLSSYLLLYALEKKGIKASRIHSEKVIRTDSAYLEANVNFTTTTLACKKYIAPLLQKNIVPIVTGFIGKDTHGDTTLLGRGGSDYTASILAVALKADEVQIWTDVNGVMSADPRFVKESISWPEMGVKMMSEMAYSGAKVVHPRSIAIAVMKNIPVYILNTFDRKFAGTKIKVDEVKDVKGIVTSDQNILLHIENPNMLDEVGFIAKVTSIVEQFGIPIDVCSTSETSFTFSVSEQDFNPKLLKSLSKVGLVRKIKNIAKVCMIGHEITQNSKIFEDVFRMCHQKKVPIQSISVGASQRNITLMIDQKCKDQVLVDLHHTWIEKRT